MSSSQHQTPHIAHSRDPTSTLMDRVQTDYTTGLPSPYPSTFGSESRSEVSPSDHTYAASQPETRQSHYTTATPTSDYGQYPASARSASFNDHIQQQRFQCAASMASNSSSLNLQDGAAHQDPQQDPQHVKSDSDVPIDPNISAHSPTTYQYPQASPYSTNPADMAHAYSHAQVYAQPSQQRPPDWTGYAAHTPITPNHVFTHHTPPASATQPGRGNQVFSFVPIPGAQQHKRPRRRYEEIERMYKCGWNGCEKAYGTLNHLNAHVTMQSHGQKRVPEEFKEIRKEWKARKKANDAARKANEEQSPAAQVANDVQSAHEPQQAAVASYAPHEPQQAAVGSYTPQAHRLPPLGYQASQYATQQSQVPMTANGEYSSNYITAGAFPSSPYQQSHQQVYGQPNGGPSH